MNLLPMKRPRDFIAVFYSRVSPFITIFLRCSFLFLVNAKVKYSKGGTGYVGLKFQFLTPPRCLIISSFDYITDAVLKRTLSDYNDVIVIPLA